MRRLASSTRAELRLADAHAWLAARPPGEEVLVIGATADAAAELIRGVATARGSGFGWHRFTLGRLAAELAKHELARRDLAPIGALPIEALCARIVQQLRDAGTLGRLLAVVDQPGLPRALARTLGELRLARATGDGLVPELAAALAALTAELARAGLADRAQVFELATAALARSPLGGHPVVLLDVPVRTTVEAALIAALVARSPHVLATVPGGDDASTRALTAVLGCEVTALAPATVAGSLARVQHHLFGAPPEPAPLDDSVAIFSAPGESRECVEIARRVLAAARAGIPFDRQAVLLRAPEHYRVHVEEAMGRAGVPVHFEQGTVLPDPAGRAFLALLACAREGLSARRFAEYLSLGEVPDVGDGTGEPRAPWMPPDEELVPARLAQRDDAVAVIPTAVAEPDAPVAAGTLRAPWRWERLLVEAAVIGGRERWARRLAGLAARHALVEDPGADPHGHAARDRADLAHLTAFALPLLDELAALPAQATWGTWLDRLAALADRALRLPDRVLGVLAALAPMADVGPVALGEVLLVLQPRLTELVVRPASRRHGRLLVASIEAARGLAFDLVFAPGLAERMFPQKLAEDPLLLDAARAALPCRLPVRADRLADERLALRLAIGAAGTRVVLSYPRIDLDQGRPRVPSFYGLEVLAAAEGALPGFDELGRRADVTGAARIGWPAPADRLDAIDEAEHDLALLDNLVRPGSIPPAGAAAYLLDANPHLRRALRFRARRWTVNAWKPADGLIASPDATDEVRAALAAHVPAARAFSPTALETLAQCPYRFVLKTIVRLQARDEPDAIEALGPLERGSLVHEVQFELLSELRAHAELPVRPDTLAAAAARLDAVVARVAARYRERLAPAIDRVWDDGIAAIRADLREWLRRTAEDLAWIPSRFELAFGLPAQDAERDPSSVAEPVALDIGVTLRGSIDLVEAGPEGALRATDSKTGMRKVKPGSIIAGGTSLQPVLYALVLEKLFPDATVAGGRLSYCTTRGEFSVVDTPLTDQARASAKLVVDTLADLATRGFFPAAPADKACTWCDFRRVCGPNEERRAKGKAQPPLVQLKRLREQR